MNIHTSQTQRRMSIHTLHYVCSPHPHSISPFPPPSFIPRSLYPTLASVTAAAAAEGALGSAVTAEHARAVTRPSEPTCDLKCGIHVGVDGGVDKVFPHNTPEV